MPRPTGIGVVDLMMGIPKGPGDDSWRRFLGSQLRDPESRETYRFPAEYMYKSLPGERFSADGAKAVLLEMDRWGVERGMITVSFDDELSVAALRDHPDRFLGAFPVDPNAGMEGVCALRRAVEELGVVAASAMPSGCNPPVPINDKRFYPLYAACIDLDIPIFVCAGVPGPRVPFAAQDVALIDEVCWFFPELRFVTRHGCEPWVDLAVKLLLKWPNLYYSTSAFAPRYYPKAIVDFANTRGADKVLYAGYFPMGLSLERIFTELDDLPLHEHVWEKFLRTNALRVLGIGG
ncbi:amidohydrolase family protein [Dactylosporangium sp. CS-047395]|uniref:amidohydrolase family protein n=1 Tax=Dactylosporangium sp. CS-047395 TaxID=3239936 RepID=UPI003D94AD5F